MKRKWKIRLAMVIVLLAIFLRIVYVNVTATPVSKQIYERGQVCYKDEIAYEVKDVHIYEHTDDFRSYFENSHYEMESPYDTKYAVVRVEVMYTGKEDKVNLPYRNFHLQCGTYTNGIWRNDRLQRDQELIRGEKKTIYLIMSIVHSKVGLSDQTWNHLEDKKFELVLSTYPDIVIMKCN